MFCLQLPFARVGMLNSSSALEWMNRHCAFAAYVLPVVLLISVLKNAFTLVALLTMLRGIGRITHAFFIAFAFADVFDLFVWYGLIIFAHYNLRYFTGGAIFLSAVNKYDAFCKPLRGFFYFTNHCSHWL